LVHPGPASPETLPAKRHPFTELSGGYEKLIGDEQGRLAKIQAAKHALEQREARLKPGQTIDDKQPISFADTAARIMGKAGSYDYADNTQISVDADLPIIVGQPVSRQANDQQAVESALQALAATAGR
jgi:hypothetical protein